MTNEKNPDPLVKEDEQGSRISEQQIREIVYEFYRRARNDELLGPIFEAHVQDWDHHLDRMCDFWSSAMLYTRKYSGRPVDKHRPLPGLSQVHFDSWIALFDATVRDICSPQDSRAFSLRARQMRAGMTNALGLGYIPAGQS
jgi:hemoglobin